MDKNIDKKLLYKFRPIKVRIMLKHIFKIGFIGVVIALMQTILWIFVSYFYPILYLNNKILISSIVIILVSILFSLIKKPSFSDMLKQCDSEGLSERLITSYELRGRDDIFAKLQKEDSLKSLNNFDIKSIKLLNISKKQIYLVIALCSVLIVGKFIPNPFGNIINRKVAVKEEINKQIEKIEKEINENLDSESNLSKLEKEQYKKMLKQLSENLRKSKDYKDALEEVSKTENELLRKIIKDNKTKMTSLGNEMMKHSETQSLGQQIAKSNQDEINKQLDKLKEKLNNNQLDEEQLKQLQNALNQIKENINDKALKTQLSAVANALSSDINNGTNLSQSKLGELQNMLSQLSTNTNINPANLTYEMQHMKYQIANASGDMNMQLAQNGTKSGNQPATNGNNGNGSGMGSGSSIGSGHTNESNNSNKSNSSKSSNGKKPQGSNTPSIGEYEKIYDPTRLGDGGEISSVKGSVGKGESEQMDMEKGIGNFNGYIPYNDVIGEYKNSAMQNIERQDIPNNMKEIVKDYFISLDQ